MDTTIDGISDFPRRVQLELNSPAELAIRNAVKEVEKIGADMKLTEAVILLDKARELVADFIDCRTVNRTISKQKYSILSETIQRYICIGQMENFPKYTIASIHSAFTKIDPLIKCVHDEYFVWDVYWPEFEKVLTQEITCTSAQH